MNRKKASSHSQILPAMAAIFVDVLSYGLITPLLVAAFTENLFLAASPQWQPIVLALAFALFPLGMFFGAATLGDLSDRWGRRKTLILCMAGLTGAFALLALSVATSSVTLLLLGRLISGLLGGSMAIGQAAIIDLSTPENKPQNLSRITIANAAAHFLGPGIGALLADNGLYLPFISISLLAIATLIWIALKMEETRTVESVAEKINWQRPFQIFAEAFANPDIRRLSWVYLLFHAGNSMSYQFFYVLLAERFDYTPGELSLFSALAMGGGGLLATFWLLPLLQKHFSPLTLSIYPLLLTGFLSQLFQVALPMELRWLIGVIWAIALISAYVSTITLYSNCVDEARQGWVMGIANSVFAFSFVIGGLSASLLSWFQVETLLTFAGLLLICSGALLYINAKRFS